MDAIWNSISQGYLEQSSPALWFYRFHKLTDDLYKAYPIFHLPGSFSSSTLKTPYENIWEFQN